MYFVLNDEMGHKHPPGAEQYLSTVTEIVTVESNVIKILGSVLSVSQTEKQELLSHMGGNFGSSSHLRERASLTVPCAMEQRVTVVHTLLM